MGIKYKSENMFGGMAASPYLPLHTKLLCLSQQQVKQGFYKLPAARFSQKNLKFLQKYQKISKMSKMFEKFGEN